MKTIISRFTMRRFSSISDFTDRISGRQVCHYKDKYGGIYMANYHWYPWGFRVKSTLKTEEQ